MDVLHLSLEEVKNIDVREFTDMLVYSWNTYNLRRIDLMMGKGDKNQDEVFTFDQSDFIGKLSKVSKPCQKNSKRRKSN